MAQTRMFTAVSFMHESPTPETTRHPPAGGWTNTPRCICTVENYPKQTRATCKTAMGFRDMTLNERSQTQNSAYCISPLHEVRKQATFIYGHRGLDGSYPERRAILTGKEYEELSGALERFWTLIWVVVSWVDTRVQIHGD